MNAIKLRVIVFLLLCVIASGVTAQQRGWVRAMNDYHTYYVSIPTADAVKEAAVEAYRKRYGRMPYRAQAYKLTAEECVAVITEEGAFADLISRERELIVKEGGGFVYTGDSQDVGLLLTDAFSRIRHIAEAFRRGELTVEGSAETVIKLQRAILYYGALELNRDDVVNRFHASCFAIPTSAVNTYFCFLEQMEAVERGGATDEQWRKVAEVLKALGLQAWTKPVRNDDTDANVVQIERFRNHVWWVGGNALAYRSLLPVAMMCRSVAMVDLLAEVCQRGISMTSQTTYNDSFWTEGFTEDGAGWGHGMQCLVWGYPIDGTIYALSILSSLKDSPWEEQLDEPNKKALFNFFRGSNWYYYKGFIPPCLDRGSMVYNVEESAIKYLNMLNLLLKEFSASFTAGELAELRQLKGEADTHLISMKGFADGMYNGTRWFFNNDDLIKKNDRYQILINMASVRCDGLESATNMADEYNFYSADGLTLLQKSGDEYRKVIGAADVTASPGVTAREGMEKLVPVTNWRGYCSKHRFAAGATHGGENAVAGFVFEKMNASLKEGVNDRGNSSGENRVLYGVKAHKGYFLLGDYLVALGAGVTNVDPEQEGHIRTTIDQTAHEASVSVVRNGKVERVEKGQEGVLSFKGRQAVWLAQEGKFAYTLLPAYSKRVYYRCETVMTDWIKRNSANRGKRDLPDSADVLRVWVDHGQRPVNDTYGYVVYAGEGVPDGQLPFRVLRNDTLVQAIESANRRVVEALFYDPTATIKTAEGQLSVSVPCALLIEKMADGYAFTATDALMNERLDEIEVTWKGRIVKIPTLKKGLTGAPVRVMVSYQ